MNMLQERVRSEPLLIGMQNFSGSPVMVEILGHCGFDWVSIDMEHSPTGYETVEHLVRAAQCSGIAPLVRVATNDPVLIMKALDRGAAGVIVPHIASVADLQEALAACRYAPEGTRGACSGVRAAKYGAEPWSDYSERANREAMLVPLIEDAAAIDVFDDLLAVEGVDVYWIGIRDLAQQLGLPGGDLSSTPELAELGQKLCAQAAAADKTLMATVSPLLTVDYASHLYNLGFRMLSFGSDVRNFMLHTRDLSTQLDAMVAA